MNLLKKTSVLVICVIVVKTTNAQTINLNPGFENGEWNTVWKENTNNKKGEFSIVENPLPVRKGKYAFYLTNTDGNRMEMISNKLTSGYYPKKPNYGPQFGRFLWDEEYWVGISIYLEDWSRNPIIWSTLVQSHTVPADWNHSACCSGDNGWTIAVLSPPQHNNHVLIFHSQILKNPMNDIPSCGAIGPAAWSIPIQSIENKWLDFVIHFKHSTTDDGFIKMWFNGELKVDQKGPNVHFHASCKGNVRIPYNTFSFGIYKDDRHNFKSSLFVDEIRIGGKDCNYSEIKPGR